MARTSLSLLAAALIGASHAYTPLEDHTFVPPFSSFNDDGMRHIPKWTTGGNGLDLNENFIRLTPDRQSRKGYLWSNTKLEGRDEWSATLRFRVSGQGKRFFGDGLAFFATQHPYYREGSLHGFTDVFKGFGVVFDSYVNTDPGHTHKDVVLVSSDGAKSAKQTEGGAAPIGCDNDFRYWEGRDDFGVFNHSAARITFRNNRISIYIDARANGDWKPCVTDISLADRGLGDGWHREAGVHLGLIATTGDLADNHDILSFQLGTVDDEVAPNPFEMSGGSLPGVISTGNQQLDDAVGSMIARANAVMENKLQFMSHHAEHQLASVHDSIKATLKKLTEQEESNKKRIEELEKRMNAKVADQVEGSITDRLSKLEEQLHASVESKIQSNVLPQLQDSMASSSRAWMLPFVGMAVVVTALSLFAYQKYRYLIKTHLL